MLTLNKLYASIRKKRGRAKILVSVVVCISQTPSGEQLQAKIVFARDRRTRKKWLALLSTDVELPDEEVAPHLRQALEYRGLLQDVQILSQTG